MASYPIKLSRSGVDAFKNFSRQSQFTYILRAASHELVVPSPCFWRFFKWIKKDMLPVSVLHFFTGGTTRQVCLILLTLKLKEDLCTVTLIRIPRTVQDDLVVPSLCVWRFFKWIKKDMLPVSVLYFLTGGTTRFLLLQHEIINLRIRKNALK